jgi:hypothetical protein
MDEFEKFFKQTSPFKVISRNPCDKGKKKGFLVTCQINDHNHHFFITKNLIELTEKNYTLADLHELDVWIRDCMPQLFP